MALQLPVHLQEVEIYQITPKRIDSHTSLPLVVQWVTHLLDVVLEFHQVLTTVLTTVQTEHDPEAIDTTHLLVAMTECRRQAIDNVVKTPSRIAPRISIEQAEASTRTRVQASQARAIGFIAHREE